jgi:hypothetical protein
MPYSLKDVNDAEALVRSLRPEAIISRGDYDWSLSIMDKNSNAAFVLFQPQRDDTGQREISSTLDEIRDICFFMGGQWTAEEAAKIAAAARRHYGVNRLH